MALWINEQTSSLSDFMTKLDTFLTTSGAGNPGWTAEDVDGAGNSLDTAAGEWAVSKSDGTDDIQIAAQWDTSSPNNLGIYQYQHASGVGNYDNTKFPYSQATDSGSGYAGTTDANLDDARHAPVGNSPIQYWCFTGDTWAYVVVEVSTDTFVHFGFGILSKFNDWTGGEFCYGYRFNGGPNNSVAVQATSTVLLDGIAVGTTSPADMSDHCATLHIEGMTDSPASGKWAAVLGSQAAAQLHNDRQTSPVARVHVLGGFRGGSHALAFGQFPGTTTMGFTPGYPIVVYHWDRDISGSSTMSDSMAPLGYMPGVRGINIANYVAGDEVTIGSDTWVVFPTRKKGATGSLTNTSAYQGVMYKKST